MNIDFIATLHGSKRPAGMRRDYDYDVIVDGVKVARFVMIAPKRGYEIYNLEGDLMLERIAPNRKDFMSVYLEAADVNLTRLLTKRNDRAEVAKRETMRNAAYDLYKAAKRVLEDPSTLNYDTLCAAVAKAEGREYDPRVFLSTT
jgi:hypothetical protein